MKKERFTIIEKKAFVIIDNKEKYEMEMFIDYQENGKGLQDAQKEKEKFEKTYGKYLGVKKE